MKRLLFWVVYMGIMLSVLTCGISLFVPKDVSATKQEGAPAKVPEGTSSFQIPTSIECYISRMNLFETALNMPHETAIVVFADGTIYFFTNQMYDRVVFPNLAEFFKSENKEIRDIVLFVHSHLIPSGFSDADKRLYEHLKGLGFTGRFGIYYPATKSVKFLE